MRRELTPWCLKNWFNKFFLCWGIATRIGKGKNMVGWVSERRNCSLTGRSCKTNIHVTKKVSHSIVL